MKPVWIVDDDRSIRWVFEKALSREGIAYNSFASAREALDALAGGPPQVCFAIPALDLLEQAFASSFAFASHRCARSASIACLIEAPRSAG